ncbi:MAG: hypothetical protein WD226_03090 [Planctomycetota bacterium]
MNRTLFGLLGSLLVLATFGFAQDGKEPLRFAQVIAPEAVARNIGDERGLPVGTFERGTPLAVYREQAGYLAVEAPGGFRAWVLGRFLATTDQPGVREVTGNGVNIRPGPKDDVRNFPLGTPLFAGDRVRILAKSDPALSDEDAWFQILTPPGVTAWMKADAVGPLPAEVDAKLAWERAVAAAAPVVRRPAPAPDAAAPTAKVLDDPRVVLEAARRRLAEERAKNVPDYGSVRAEFERAKRLAGEGVVAVEAQSELERVEALEDVASLRDRLENERQRIVTETAEAQAEAWNRQRRADPLGALFHARGVLERRLETDGTPHYVLVAGGTSTHELVSTSGRYDLDVFLGCQVGVRGSKRTLLGTQILTVEALEVVAHRTGR